MFYRFPSDKFYDEALMNLLKNQIFQLLRKSNYFISKGYYFNKKKNVISTSKPIFLYISFEKWKCLSKNCAWRTKV